ncbi:Uncharacterised protein [Bordetella pertussis]|nr:Uncharacterised protein [Bordetella pertussis]
MAMPTDIHAMAVSSNDALTVAPCPVRLLRYNAEITPITDHMPEPKSTMETPEREGGWPFSPVRLMMPENACISGS